MSTQIILQLGDQWRRYLAPQEIIQTRRLEEVLPCLAQIEQRVEAHGWHALGFLSYEAAPAFDPAMQTHPAGQLPLLWFGLFQPEAATAWQPPTPAAESAIPAWKPTQTRPAYQKAIRAIKDAIALGETYQVNYTFRLRKRFNTDPLALFTQMIAAQPVRYAALIETDEFAICSASPELFFRQEGDQITCQPMKGTAPRGYTLIQDRAQAAGLAASIKNRAENVMIVDMIRNDLGRLARIGSVQVPALFSVERYRTLWQMTSTVQASSNASISQTLAALFPCASITGAPKISTMRIIRALETTPRGVYTGAIGWIGPGRQAQFNVAIRTVSIDKTSRQAEYGTGSGVVWDSTPRDEYEEALLKARVITQPQPVFDLLETLRWTPAEGYFLREKHIQRMRDSAEYFGIELDSARLAAYLDQIAASLSGPSRVRITLTPGGALDHQTAALPEASAPLRACLAPAPLHSDNIHLYHKTTHRAFYHSAPPGFDDVLHYNQHGELTEFSIGNLVVELENGQRVTPPVSSGVLPGVFRAQLLEQGQIQERVIHLKDLVGCRGIHRINSVRGWQNAIMNTENIQNILSA